MNGSVRVAVRLLETNGEAAQYGPVRLTQGVN